MWQNTDCPNRPTPVSTALYVPTRMMDYRGNREIGVG